MYDSAFVTIVDSLHELSEPAAPAHLVDVLVFTNDVEQAAILGVLHYDVDPARIIIPNYTARCFCQFDYVEVINSE